MAERDDAPRNEPADSGILTAAAAKERREGAASLLRLIAVASGLLLPSLTLVPLGSLWLWEKGYLLHWAVAAAVLVAAAFAWQRWLLRRPARPERRVPQGPVAPSKDSDAPDPHWSPVEQEAWKDVLAIARKVDPDRLASREEALAVATRTIRAVAARLHPQVAEPMWQFTVPEALAIVERVSQRLSRFFAGHVPLSDRLTVARVLSLYRWKGTFDLAEKAYDVWRLVRIFNPVAAATNEMREALSRQMLQWGRDHVASALAAAYVREVGRAAIDLYGGRLAIGTDEFETHVTAASRRDLANVSKRAAEPLRLMVTGQKGAGKSSLVRALASEVLAEVDVEAGRGAAPLAYELRKPSFPPALLIDCPALGAREAEIQAVVEQAFDCDLILWVVSAVRPDTELDRRTLAHLLAAFASQPHRRAPPVLGVVTYVDRLPPADEWAPPYDLKASRPKSVAIRGAVERAMRALAEAGSEVVPVSLAPGRIYNVDLVWSRMLTLLPAARSAQLTRRLQSARSGWSWRQIGNQAINAGKMLARSLRR